PGDQNQQLVPNRNKLTGSTTGQYGNASAIAEADVSVTLKDAVTNAIGAATTSALDNNVAAYTPPNIKAGTNNQGFPNAGFNAVRVFEDLAGGETVLQDGPLVALKRPVTVTVKSADGTLVSDVNVQLDPDPASTLHPNTAESVTAPPLSNGVTTLQ